MARKVTERGFGIDTTELTQFVKRLRKEEPKIALKMRREMRAAAKLVEAEAKARLDDYPSVVPTVKAHVSGASTYVSTGSKAVPLGGLLEAGNTGKAKSVAPDLGVAHGTFRHPVYEQDGRGSAPWVDQPTHPHLGPAAVKVAPVAQARVMGALKGAMEEAGFTDV